MPTSTGLGSVRTRTLGSLPSGDPAPRSARLKSTHSSNIFENHCILRLCATQTVGTPNRARAVAVGGLEYLHRLTVWGQTALKYIFNCSLSSHTEVHLQRCQIKMLLSVYLTVISQSCRQTHSIEDGEVGQRPQR